MLKFFLLILFLEKITDILNYIVLPIHTMKKENYKSLYSPNSLKDRIYSEHCSPFFTELEIGTPPQKIPLLVKFKANDYVITSIHPSEKNISDYYVNKSLYDFSESFLKNYKFFDENSSYTFDSKYCQKRDRYYKYEEYDWPIAEETCPSYDKLFLYNDLKMKNKINENLYFDLVRTMKDNVTGLIGLSLNNDRRTPNSFLSLLKTNNITDNYFWFFEFDSAKSENGKLIIGSTLDEIYGDKYDRSDLYYAKGNTGYIYNTINFDKIFIKNNSETTDLPKDKAELSFDINSIVASYDYKLYFKKIINDLYIKQKCFNDTFEGCKDFFSSRDIFIFFYCKNEPEVKEELKRIILPIQFYSNELNFTFEITYDDILKEDGEYIFIKMLFQEWGRSWTFGKPFSLKYKFVFNPDIKQIGFYPKYKTKKGLDINWKIVIEIMIIIGLCVIFAVLGIILGKKLYGLKRKKRANEMNDDDYEYFSENKKEKDNDDGRGNNYNRNPIN